MSQILNFAGERNRASEGDLQARIAIERFCQHARELTQWPAAHGNNHGVHIMAADSVRQGDKVNEPNP